MTRLGLAAAALALALSACGAKQANEGAREGPTQALVAPMRPCRNQKARFLSSKKGRSSPTPLMTGRAGEFMRGKSSARRCGVASR